MQNLYKVITSDVNVVKIQLSDEKHPIFEAHFPNMPILPAFIVIDLVEKLFFTKVIEVKKAKFIKPILPNSIITYQKEGDVFKIFHKEEIVASLNLCTTAS